MRNSSSGVRVISGDTDFGVDLAAYSSRQRLMTGHAVKESAEEVKRQVLEVLVTELNVSIAELDIKDDRIVFKKGPVDFSSIRRRYINKERRGWSDNP